MGDESTANSYGGSCNLGNGKSSSGPLQSTGSTLASGLQSFTASVTVPQDPVAADANTWLFWWIGSMPSDYSHVLQPVLTYNKFSNWEVANWDCCPGGNQIRSAAVSGLVTNEQITMSITAQTWNQYQLRACRGGGSGECSTLVATNTGSQVVPIIQFETYNVGRSCGQQSCATARCNFLPTSSLVMDSIEVSPPTTWGQVTSRCYSLSQACGWSINQYRQAQGYASEAVWATPPR